MGAPELTAPHTIAVVVPVYQGVETLGPLLESIRPLASPHSTPNGACAVVSEVVLVDDNGPDNSDEVIRKLTAEYVFVRPIWLSRSYGQHAATLAGMASTTSDWIVTLDEDGQHNPADISRMLDVALRSQVPVVYAAPTGPPPDHGKLRRLSSRFVRGVFLNVLSTDSAIHFHSFRLVLGDVGRSVAAYAGAGVYLDVALSWVADGVAACPVELSSEGGRTSGYSFRGLLSHFWRLVLTSGTRPLRMVSAVGGLFASTGFLSALVIVIGRVAGRIEVGGWASISVIMLVGFGTILFALGLVAEYVGVAATMAMGKPPFLIVDDRLEGPLGRGS